MKIAAAFVLMAGAALADEQKAPAAAPPAQAAAPGKPGAEEQAMMEKYMKAATPGPEHQQMARMAGKWKLQVTAWMMPGAPPQKSDGTAEFRPILGGRYIEQEVHGSMGGQPFEGKGLEGYDNVAKEHFGTWVDNMSTGPMTMKGRCTSDGRKCAMAGKMSDAVAGKQVKVTSTTVMKDDNNFVMEMMGPGPDGKPFKTLELVYTRAQ